MLLFLYNLLLPFLLIISFPFYLRRMIRRGGYARNFFQRFGFFSRRIKAELSKGDWTWIRAVSVGEVLTGLHLAQELKKQDPACRILISTTTSTGYQLALERAGDLAQVIYSPIDSYPLLNPIWGLVQPKRIVLIDSDLWPSFLALARENRTPVFLANARLSPKSESRYRRFRPIAKLLFWKQLTAVLAQDRPDAHRWMGLGLRPEQVTVTGSIKYDTEGAAPEPDLRFVKWLEQHGIDSTRRRLLGGSLHPGEEELLINVFQELCADFPDLFLVLVPRHFERTPEVEALLRSRSIPYTLRSKPDFTRGTNVLIVDSTGELNDFYQTATVVVIGKSFRGTGGQNPVEPILAGKPVICGPHMENFKFLVTELVREGGVKQLTGDPELAPAIRHLLTNPKAAAQLVSNADRVLDHHRGATARAAALVLRPGERW
jgi:3-deoxy-D-manno-octulosonic-acid transferase